MQLDSISGLKLGGAVDEGVVDLIVFVGHGVCSVRRAHAASDGGLVQNQVKNDAGDCGDADRDPNQSTIGGTDSAEVSIEARLSNGGPCEA